MGTDTSLQESLRRQLEGRWEDVEQARIRYDGLLRQLDSGKWRQLLRASPAHLTSVREQEPRLIEVLEYVEHRALHEHWPANHPGLTVVRALRSQRARLETLARRRLQTLTLDMGASLPEVLGRLDTLLREPRPEPPGKDESVLLEEGTAEGHLWLTPKRLLWVPYSGEPVQVLLASLPPGRISSRRGALRVEGPRTVTMSTGRRTCRYLAALIEAVRQMAQTREASSGPGEVVICRAWCHRQHTGGVADASWGVCVLRPGYVAFLPAYNTHPLERWLLNLNKDRRKLPALSQEESLVEFMRQLPKAEFDASMEALAQAIGGCFWPAGTAELFLPKGPEAQKGFRLVHEGRVLTVCTRQHGREADSLVKRWPVYAGPPHLDPAVLHPLRRHLPTLAFILAGSVVFPSIMLVLDGGPSKFTLLGIALGLVGSCAYAKAKGHSALSGLSSLLVCGWPVFLFSLEDRNTPPPLE